MDVFGGRAFFDGFASSVMAVVDQAMGHWFGQWVNDPVLGPVTTADLFAAAIPIILALAVDILLVLIYRWQVRHAPRPPRWRGLLYGGARGPLYFYVWLAAIYFSLTPILLKCWPGARKPIDGVFTVVFLIALLWLCAKLTGITKTQLNNGAVKIPSRAAKFVVPLVGRSLRAIIPVIILISAWPLLGLSQRYPIAFWYFSGIFIVGVIAWILMQAVEVAERTLLAQYDIGLADNLQARKVYTQTHLLSRTSEVAIGVLAIASILMLFPPVRHVGASVLASAGIVGVVAGIAAQKTLANFIAGFQIALAQPFRHDDVVVVESEWGRIEEITLTYVVVRIWDERRMVLPLTYFIERPFQNWTRHTATLLGSVGFWVDYTFPVEEGRNALKGIIENHPLWDKRFWSLQVSDCNEKAMELRVLATATDASNAWNLRCGIREQFIAFIQKNYPKCLPRFRAEIDNKIHQAHSNNDRNRDEIETRQM